MTFGDLRHPKGLCCRLNPHKTEPCSKGHECCCRLNGKRDTCQRSPDSLNELAAGALNHQRSSPAEAGPMSETSEESSLEQAERVSLGSLSSRNPPTDSDGRCTSIEQVRRINLRRTVA